MFDLSFLNGHIFSTDVLVLNNIIDYSVVKD